MSSFRRCFERRRLKVYNRQAIFLFSNDTKKILNAPHVRDVKNSTTGPLVTIPITFSRHTRPAVPPFFQPTARPLLRDFGDPIDRPSSSSSGRQAAEEDITCPSEKGLILSIPRARTRQVRVTRLGDNRDDNRKYEGEKSPARSRTSLLSRTRRTGCCILEVILWSECAAR